MVSAFPDLKVEVQNLLAEGDRVAVQWWTRWFMLA
jgi:predicted ester cyclase